MATNRSFLIAATVAAGLSCSAKAQTTETQSSSNVLTLSEVSFRKTDKPQTLGDTWGPAASIHRRPLIMVDGVVATAQTQDGKPSLLDTKVSDIAAISVVKDPSELAKYSTLYGSDATHGVILVTTKSSKEK